MKVSPVKGTRDFYPPLMAVRNAIVDGWKSASRRNAFEEYDGPIFEHLKMYQIKSGDEIVEQLFSFQDRGGSPTGLERWAMARASSPMVASVVTRQSKVLERAIV